MYGRADDTRLLGQPRRCKVLPGFIAPLGRLGTGGRRSGLVNDSSPHWHIQADSSCFFAYTRVAIACSSASFAVTTIDAWRVRA